MNFHRSFPIREELTEGAYQERFYNPAEHGDSHNYPDAFCELMGDEESSLICHRSEEDQDNWRENPLFKETWVPLVSLHHVMYYTDEDSMNMPPPGLEDAPSSVTSQRSQVGQLSEGQIPNHFPHWRVLYVVPWVQQLEFLCYYSIYLLIPNCCTQGPTCRTLQWLLFSALSPVPVSGLQRWLNASG